MSNYIVRDGELYHWGIKGMKWGQRRYQNKDGTLTPAGRKRYGDDPHEDYKRARAKTKVEYMSDKELREANARLQAERQYQQMTAKPSKLSSGKKAVVGILAGTATAIASEYAKKYAKRAVDGYVANGKILDMAVNKFFKMNMDDFRI